MSLHTTAVQNVCLCVAEAACTFQDAPSGSGTHIVHAYRNSGAGFTYLKLPGEHAHAGIRNKKRNEKRTGAQARLSLTCRSQTAAKTSTEFEKSSWSQILKHKPQPLLAVFKDSRMTQVKRRSSTTPSVSQYQNKESGLSWQTP